MFLSCICKYGIKGLDKLKGLDEFAGSKYIKYAWRDEYGVGYVGNHESREEPTRPTPRSCYDICSKVIDVLKTSDPINWPYMYRCILLI